MSSEACNGEERSSSTWAMVVAQLVEQSLPTPENRSLNPNIGKILSRKDENKEREAGNGPSSLKKKLLQQKAKKLNLKGFRKI